MTFVGIINVVKVHVSVYSEYAKKTSCCNYEHTSVVGFIEMNTQGLNHMTPHPSFINNIVGLERFVLEFPTAQGGLSYQQHIIMKGITSSFHQ